MPRRSTLISTDSFSPIKLWMAWRQTSSWPQAFSIFSMELSTSVCIRTYLSAKLDIRGPINYFTLLVKSLPAASTTFPKRFTYNLNKLLFFLSFSPFFRAYTKSPNPLDEIRSLAWDIVFSISSIPSFYTFQSLSSNFFNTLFTFAEISVIGIKSNNPAPAGFPFLPFWPPPPKRLSITYWASPLNSSVGCISLSDNGVSFSNSPCNVFSDWGFISFIKTSKDFPVCWYNVLNKFMEGALCAAEAFANASLTKSMTSFIGSAFVVRHYIILFTILQTSINILGPGFLVSLSTIPKTKQDTNFGLIN